MSIPGFTAQASLYKTSELYQFKEVYQDFRLNENMTVYPQGCGWIKRITCGAAIAACVPLCISFPPPANVACWAGCLGGSLFGFCRDCIPGI